MKRLLVPLLAFGLIAGACGGSDDADSGVATLETENTIVAGEDAAVVAGEVDAEEAMMEMAACLREQGLDIDDPTVDSEGNVQFGGFRGGAGEEGEDGEPVDRELMREAMAECQDELEGVTLGFGNRDFDQTEMQDTMVEWAACMRENGYDMDDPDLSSMGAGGGGNAFSEIDPDDPDYIAANEVCSEILGNTPMPGAGRGQGPGGGGNG